MKRSCLLLVSGAISIFGIAPSAFAEPVTRNTEFSVTVNPYLNVTLSSNDVHLPITPSSGGTYGSTYFTATASTNNALGYSLNLSIKDTNTAAAQLTTNLTSDTINVNDGTKPVIPTFSTNDVLTSAEFSASTSTDHLNHWAMSLNDTDHYQKVLSESTIATSDEPIADDVTTLNLATKLDLLTPPGSYSAYFNFEIVANVDDSIHTDGKYPADSLLRAYEIAYTNAGKPMYIEDENATTIPGWRPMTSADTAAGKQVRFAIQDINMTFTEDGETKTVCEWAKSSTADNSYIDEALVLDIRDGNSYFIAKTPDDKCWMTQNLNLTLSNNKTLSHADTDLGWTTMNTDASWTPPVKAESIAIGSDYNNWYSDTEPRSVEGGESWVGPSSNDAAYDVEYTTFADCVAAFSEDACRHYHVGNYYNWAAAVATDNVQGMTTNYAVAPDSICPAGWRLPITRDSNDTVRDINQLLRSEGILQDQSPYWSDSYVANVGYNKVRRAPLYFTKSGDIASNSNRDDYLSQGQYWSATEGEYGSGYYYMTGTNYFNTASNSTKLYGMTVRCIAR